MIVVCPACARRYRIDRSRLSAGVRLRCSGCRQVFDSRPPVPPAMNRPVSGTAAPVVAQPPDPAVTEDAPLILIGDENRPFRATAQRILEALGCRVETSERGEAVFRATVNRRPALLLLNNRLPGLSGSAVCEGVKGSPHLKSIKVVLVSSTLNPPSLSETVRPGFEPDDQFEDTILEAELHRRLAFQLGRGSPETERRPGAERVAQQTPPQPVDTLSAPQEPPRPAARELDPRDVLDPAAEIERLARIMLSDLKLYNPDRFRSAMQDGRLLETFRNELLRGRDLVTTRFPDLPDRTALLTAALRRGIEEEQQSGAGTYL